jgi:hypothetical protein
MPKNLHDERIEIIINVMHLQIQQNATDILGGNSTFELFKEHNRASAF